MESQANSLVIAGEMWDVWWAYFYLISYSTKQVKKMFWKMVITQVKGISYADDMVTLRRKKTYIN